MASSLNPGLRLNCLPTRPAREANVGWNVGKQTAAEIAKLVEVGATYIRCQPAWDGVENPDTKALTLPAPHSGALQAYAAAGIKPVFVAAYGSPRKRIAEVPVLADAPVGAYAVKVGEPPVPWKPRYDFVMHGGEQITKRWAYYGSIVAEATPGELRLGSALTVPLKAGDVLRVNRLTYQPMFKDDPDSPEVAAYLRYARFLAVEIGRAGCEGYVCLWNEDSWAHDQWNHGIFFFDTPPPDVQPIDRMKSILKAALRISDLPEGVSFINGASDKSGNSTVNGVLNENDGTSITHDGIHPYGTSSPPETQGWDQQYHVSERWPTDYVALDPLDKGSNFKNMQGRYEAAGNGLKLAMTEGGTNTTDDVRHARYLLRRFIVNWGMGIDFTTLYAFTVPAWNVIDEKTLTPRASYTAVKRLMTLVRGLGDSGSPASIPALIGAPDLPHPLLTTGLHGDRGGALFAWQRTHLTDGATYWPFVPSPPPGAIDLYLPPEYTADAAVNLRTGERIDPVVNGTHIKLPQIADDPVAITTRVV